jgi:hypothetical protein
MDMSMSLVFVSCALLIKESMYLLEVKHKEESADDQTVAQTKYLLLLDFVRLVQIIMF